jgi:DNA-binding transcriptional ArsR family regulator
MLNPSLDMWRVGGLSSACRTYEQLLLGESKASVIAQNLGLHPRSVFRHLNMLSNGELAERKPDGSWVPRERNPDPAAEEIGTLGKGVEQHLRHQHESEDFWDHLEGRERADQRRRQQLLEQGGVQVGRYGEILTPGRRSTKKAVSPFGE